MSSTRGRLYTDLFAAYGKAYPDKKATTKQSEVNALWSELKSDEAMVKEKIQELERVTSRRKSKLLGFWGKVGHFFFFSSICTWPLGVYILRFFFYSYA